MGRLAQFPRVVEGAAAAHEPARAFAYHGATAASITMTGDPRRWASEPSISGVVHFIGPYTYRSSFHAENEQQESERALNTLMGNMPGMDVTAPADSAARPRKE